MGNKRIFEWYFHVSKHSELETGSPPIACVSSFASATPLQGLVPDLKVGPKLFTAPDFDSLQSLQKSTLEEKLLLLDDAAFIELSEVLGKVYCVPTAKEGIRSASGTAPELNFGLGGAKRSPSNGTSTSFACCEIKT